MKLSGILAIVSRLLSLYILFNSIASCFFLFLFLFPIKVHPKLTATYAQHWFCAIGADVVNWALLLLLSFGGILKVPFSKSPTAQSQVTLAVIATTTFQNEICGGIKSVTLPQDGQTCLYPFPCGI